MEMFGLLAENFDDVLESVLTSLEETLSKDDSAEKLKRNVLRNSYNPLERLIIPAIAFGVESSLSVLNPALSCNASVSSVLV